jgi:hypothetical protein
MESKQNKLIYINFTFMIIIGVFSVLGFVAFLKSSRSNFQASSTNYCIPCADKSGNSYTNTDGTSVPCRTIENWLKSPNGGGKIGISFIDDGSGNEIMTVTQSQKLLNYNANNTEKDSYVNVDKLLSNSVYYEMMNLFNMSFANIENYPSSIISYKQKSNWPNAGYSITNFYLDNPKFSQDFIDKISNFITNKPNTMKIYLGQYVKIPTTFKMDFSNLQGLNNNIPYPDTLTKNENFIISALVYVPPSDPSYSTKLSEPSNVTELKTQKTQKTPNGYEIKTLNPNVNPLQNLTYESDNDIFPADSKDGVYMFVVNDSYIFDTFYNQQYNNQYKAPYVGNGL